MTSLASSLRDRFRYRVKKLVKLREDTSGLALVEFAYSLPIVLSLGMLGAETANYVITHMRVSQIAMQIADSASRVGEQDVLVARRVFEADINDVFLGAEKLGDGINLMSQGRVILSSLQEYDPDPADANPESRQEIRWQRCRGAKNFVSSYGVEGDGSSDGSFPGMGEPGSEITAAPGTAVMFAEISYTYDSLTYFDFLDGEEITYTAAFNIRDSRDLTGLYNDPPADTVASCATFSAT